MITVSQFLWNIKGGNVYKALTQREKIFFLLFAISLPHGQLWAIIEEAVSLTRC